MENRVISKNVIIGNKTYQINKTPARDACWLFAFLGAKADNKSILVALGKCTREEFYELQTLVLRYVFRIDNGTSTDFPMPIIGPSGGWADTDLSVDAVNVYSLTTQAIAFNIQPFFAESESSSQQQNQ